EGRHSSLPQEFQHYTKSSFGRNTHGPGSGHYNTMFKRQRLASTANLQDSQPLRFGLGLSQDESNQPRHIVDMDELYAILQILSSVRQHAREALAFFPHALRAIAAAVWGAAKRANQIILHAGSRKDMRAQHVDAASPQRRCALLHHAIRFHLVNRVRQSVA